MRSILEWLAVILCILSSARAHAEPALAEPTNAEAHAHLDQGVKLYNLREFEKAIVEYKQGALIQSVSVFDFALGQCYRQLGKYEEAIWYYERFIKDGHPTSKVLKAVNGFISQMRAELDKKAMTQPPTEPTPETVSHPSASPTNAAPGPAPVTSALVAPAGAAATTTTVAPRESRAWSRLGWSLTAAGVVGAGVTTWLTVSAAGLDNDANDTSRTTSNRVDLEHQADSRRRTALIVGVGSGAAVILGVLTLALPARADARSSGTAWHLGISGSSVAVLGRF